MAKSVALKPEQVPDDANSTLDVFTQNLGLSEGARY